MSLTRQIVPVYVPLLRNMSAWLDKAASQLTPEKVETLMSVRLAPDMFPLSTQVRFACVQAWEAASRLRDQPCPPLVGELIAEGGNAGEQPGSIADAQARIVETIDMLEGLDDDALDADPQGPLAHEVPNGMVFEFTAEEYVRDWTVPQFYFHIVAAYAILRAEGIEMGKADYVAHLFGKVRPDTIPAQ